MPLATNIYRMNKEQAVVIIKQLAQEVGWDNFLLLLLIRSWAEGHCEGRMKRKPSNMKLDDLLAAISELTPFYIGPENLDINKLFWWLVEKATFKISLDNLDDNEGVVMIECNSQILATHDQSVAGAMWECPSDMTTAYAMPCDHPNLLKDLIEEGYIVNDDNYCPPDPPEPATCPACGGPLVSLGTLGNLEHSRCRDCGAQTEAAHEDR